jgi:hypothetical protein
MNSHHQYEISLQYGGVKYMLDTAIVVLSTTIMAIMVVS